MRVTLVPALEVAGVPHEKAARSVACQSCSSCKVTGLTLLSIRLRWRLVGEVQHVGVIQEGLRQQHREEAARVHASSFALIGCLWTCDDHRNYVRRATGGGVLALNRGILRNFRSQQGM